jgi:hypothetical protein
MAEMRKTTTIHVLMIAALAACNGTRTGNPIEPGGDNGGSEPGNGGVPTNTQGTGEGAIGNCDAKPSDLDSLDADTRLGFSANDVLAFAGGVHETKIRWAEDGFATFAPETGEHGLRIEITRSTGKKARFVEYEEHMRNGDESGPAIDIGLAYADCMSLGAIEIDVDVAIKSDGGALDEKGMATLRATNASWATLDLDLKAEDIHGDLALQSSKPAGFELDAITINLGLSPLGARGGVQTTLTMKAAGGDSMAGTSTGGAAGRGGAASIGDSASCDEGGFEVALDAKLNAFDAQDAIDRVNGLQDVAFTWTGGTQAHAAFAFDHDGSGVCAVLDPSLLFITGAGMDTDGLLRVHGTLHVTSDDDRIDADWPVVLQALAAADGSLGDITLELQSPNLVDAMTLDVEAEYGITGIDTTGFDAARVAFMLQIAAGDAHAVTGMLNVNGIKHAICPPPPADPSMGTPGCRGDDITDLASATFE